MLSDVLISTWEQVRALARRGTPLLAMELRVHSRQGRTYVFRALYVVLLLLYVALIWENAVSLAHAQSGQAWSQTIMADVAQSVTRNVLVFQLIAGQAAAIILMCGAFSDEFAHGRLPALLTTPLSNAQVVAGKYLSRLVQLLVLMLATLPVLAIVRLFGGVSWLFLLGGTFLALVAALFTAAVTLLNSLKFPKPHLAASRSVPAGLLVSVVGLGCLLLTPQSSAWVLWFVSVAGLAATVAAVHYGRLEFPLAVRRAVGDWRMHPTPSMLDKSYVNYAYLPSVPDEKDVLSRGFKHSGDVTNILGDIDRVRGNPLFWKATRRLNRSLSVKQLLGGVVAFLLFFYGAALTAGGLTSATFHMGALGMVMGAVAVWCGFLAACSISMEKETGFWPLVLATPMDSSAIFLQRVRVVVDRSWLLFAAAGLHLVAFMAAGVLHAAAVAQVLVALTWAAVFVVAVGMYSSARARTTTGAMLRTVSVLSALWLGVPLLAYLLGALAGGGVQEAMRWVMASSPFVQLWVALSGGIEQSGQFAPMTWRDSGGNELMSVSHVMLMTTLWATVHGAAAVWLIHATVRSFRRRAYD